MKIIKSKKFALYDEGRGVYFSGVIKKKIISTTKVEYSRTFTSKREAEDRLDYLKNSGYSSFKVIEIKS